MSSTDPESPVSRPASSRPLANIIDELRSPEQNLAAVLPPPPAVVRRGEDDPLPLRENNSAAAFDAALLSAAPGEAGAPSCASQRPGAHVVAALNFNAKRTPFAPFDEATDGKVHPQHPMPFLFFNSSSEGSLLP